MSEPAIMPALADGRRRRPRPRVPEEVEPGTDVGGYGVEARLGSGGFGTVFRAQRGGQPYALKVLELARVGPSAIREVLALSRLHHPNVVGLHGFWQWPDQQPHSLVVVMEYVSGRQLDVWTATENPSALGVLRMVLGVARGLEAVHAAGLVHCDVKEANLVVREPEQQAVLVDFGVSGGGPNSPNAGGWPRGTQEYRSPEAWHFIRSKDRRRGARYQHTTADDMYALGVVLYGLLTDVQPFDPVLTGGIEAVMEQAPVPPHERNPRVPEELSRLCLDLLEKQPEARPAATAVCQRAEQLLTRQGEAWEHPLCTPFSVHNVTTAARDPMDDGEQWVKQAREQARNPRRGRRPPHPVARSSQPLAELAPGAVAPPAPVAAPLPEVAPAPCEPPAPVAPPARMPSAGAVLPAASAHEAPALAQAEEAAPAPVAPQPEASPRPSGAPVRRGAAPALRVSLIGALGLVVATLVAVALHTARLVSPPPSTPEPSGARPVTGAVGHGGWEPVLPTWRSGGKVAAPLKPPEAERAVPLAPEGAPPAPVAAGATAPPAEASVNTEQHKQPKRLGAARKAAALLSTCTALAACSGPSAEVRPPPVTAEPCPPGSLEAMEQLGISTGDGGDALFTWHKGDVEPVPIQEGWTTVWIGFDLGKLEAGTVLSGRIILTPKRAYGHFVQATTEDGKTYPVCLNWVDGDRNDRGEVASTLALEVVREFK